MEGFMAPNANTFRNILVPLDGSPFAEEALAVARSVAEPAGAALRLGLVHEGPFPAFDQNSAKALLALEVTSRKGEREYLRRLQANLRAVGIKVPSAVTLTGNVGESLAEYARESGIDLVVMATHGRGGLGRAWMGSVADYLSRHLEVPLLLVRPRENGKASLTHRGNILVPLDGSPLAEQVLEPASMLARLWGTELTLLWVVRPMPVAIDPMLVTPNVYDEDATASWRAQAQDYLDGIVDRLRDDGIRASAVASIGWSAVETILNLGRPENFGLIALATHGRGGIRRLALGSVADKVIRGSEVPVLVYHPSRRVTPVGQTTRRPGATARRRTSAVK
jgi:nucleotide-binding universal stress UspA family protein